MSFNVEVRNKLASMVGNARKLLRKEFQEQLQELYGIQLDGRITPIQKLTYLDDEQLAVASLLRQGIEYLESSEVHEKNPTKTAINRFLHEQSFTVLNRFAALRLCEKRGIIQECLKNGVKSKGFQVYLQIAGSGIGDRFKRYKTFLLCLFDDIACDLGILFDRFSREGLLFPRENALLLLLEIINEPSLCDIWSEDETIGWIYQYFNSKEEREAMRKASGAPRNSRELAVRNQFFTPRYVVRFLSDNTLGRIWYEMQKGKTCLKEYCEYLVIKPNEVFLDSEESPPDDWARPEYEHSSQDGLLKKAEYIFHRYKKDPREIKILDPACGSGHFLLYVFDLLLKIYEEAWKDTDSPTSEISNRKLQNDYNSLQELRRYLPVLILKFNLYGIDIDRRACQIAALALWLRVQRYYNENKIKPIDRPPIEKTNIVVAEPMSGDEEQVERFIQTIKDKSLQAVFETVFDEMELAGEAGSLLKIEDHIKEIIKGEIGELGEIFLKEESARWNEVELKLINALELYSELSLNNKAHKARLFSDDASLGFAFIDSCRNLYDVVLMNPPFGEPTNNTKSYLKKNYKDSYKDLYPCFILRAISWLSEQGLCGAITNRSGFFIVSLENWRKNSFLESSRLKVLADLGYGVLDAMVETAIYTIENSTFVRYGNFHKATSKENKEDSLRDWINSWKNEHALEDCYIQNLSIFEKLPSCRIAFWIPYQFINIIETFRQFRELNGIVAVGLQTSDNFRFLRLAWEIPPKNIGLSKRSTSKNEKKWVFYAKGGEYSPYYADIHLVVNWLNAGKEVKNFADLSGNIISYPRNEKYYFMGGLTYSERTTSNFSARILPPGCCFDTKGPWIGINSEWKISALLPIFMSRIVGYLLEFAVSSGDVVYSGSAARDYTSRSVSEIPFPEYNSKANDSLSKIGYELWKTRQKIESNTETDRYFIKPSFIKYILKGVKEATKINISNREEYILKILQLSLEGESLVKCLYKIDSDENKFLELEYGKHPLLLSENNEISDDEFKRIYNMKVDNIIDSEVHKSGGKRFLTKKSYFSDREIEVLSHALRMYPELIIKKRRELDIVKEEEILNTAEQLVQYLFGCIFGRWDVRFCLDDSLISNLPGPNENIPVCSPGTLVGTDGLPATLPPNEYPFDFAVEGIIVNDSDHKNSIINKVRDILFLIAKDKAANIEQELCQILNVRKLLDYINNTNRFFNSHLKYYSKSRRKAPIYWPLSTLSDSYSLWIYYHRLTDQTLYSCVSDYLNPKIIDTEKDIQRFLGELKADNNSKEELEKLTNLKEELEDFRDELLRVAELPYKPNLNDGVVISACPLWKFFQHPQWQNELKKCWEKLKAGEYDWAHLAYSIWPERVKEKCKSDKSLAIAHRLEDLYKGS